MCKRLLMKFSNSITVVITFSLGKQIGRWLYLLLVKYTQKNRKEKWNKKEIEHYSSSVNKLYIKIFNWWSKLWIKKKDTTYLFDTNTIEIKSFFLFFFKLIIQAFYIKIDQIILLIKILSWNVCWKCWNL